MSTHSRTLVSAWSADASFAKEEMIDVNALAVLIKSDDLSSEDHKKLGAIKKKLVRGRYLDSMYKLGKNIKGCDTDVGRLCVLRGVGLQALPRQIRGALAMANYFDVDIEGCHPTLCLQICEKQGIACDNQREFLVNRSRYIDELCEHMQIDRTRAKERINALYFGYASASDGMPEFFIDSLHPELVKARELIVNLTEWTEHIKFLRGKENRVGKAFAFILQTIERSCLLELDASATRNGRSMDVFIHDGGLIRKLDEEKAFPADLLRTFEDDIAKHTGFKVRLAVKPLTTDLDVSNASDANYTSLKKEFEKTCFKLMNPPCYVRIYNNEINFLDITGLGHDYANLYVDGDLFITKWRADPLIRTYERIDFVPGMTPPADTFNLWRGFPTVPVPGDISAIQDVLLTNCNHEQEVFEWMENYVAHMIQKPYEKPGVCVCFQSEEEGAGKETYWDFVGEMIGTRHFFNTSRPEDTVFGRFTGSLKEVLLIKFEEADFQTNRKNESGLKSLITSEHSTYESKGKDAITLQSYCRLVMTTNEDVPFVVRDTSRRFMMVRCSPKNVGNREYWNDIHARLAPAEAKSAYFHYLLNRDISKFNPRDYPKTEYLKETITATRPYMASFFQREIERCYTKYALDDKEPENEVIEYTARELFTKMNEHAKYPISETKYGRDIKQYPVEKKCRRTGNCYQFETQKMREFLHTKQWWMSVFSE